MFGFRRERTESRTYAVGASRANAACLHSAPFTFAALDLDDDVTFPVDRAAPALRLHEVRRARGDGACVLARLFGAWQRGTKWVDG
jgi:hypothetical protein